MLTLKQIDAHISAIRKSGAGLDAKIHETAVAVLIHGKEHGDVSRAAKLLDAMPRSVRASALKTWFVTFSPVRFRDDGTSYLGGKADQRVWRIEAANATPFYDLKTNRDPVPFDIEKALASVLNRYQKAIDDGRVIENADRAKELAATVAKLGVIKEKEGKVVSYLAAEAKAAA